MQTNIIGVDIGDYSLKLVELSGGAVKKTASAQMPDGLAREGEILSAEAMAEFIRNTARSVGMGKGKCAVILPDSMVYSKTITVPAMAEQQLKYSLPYEFRDYVSEDKGRYFYDYAVQGVNMDENGQPKELRLFACAAPRSGVASYRSMLRQAGLNLKSAAPTACAYSGIVSAYEQRTGEKGSDYCFIDLGHSSTGIYMLNGSNYNTHRSLNLSAADLIAAVSDSMNVDEHMARTYVLSNYKNVLDSEECTRVYNAIAVEVVKAINFYNFNNRDNSLGRVYVCGGGAEITQLVDAVSGTLGLEVHRVDELMPEGDFAESKPCTFAKAVGIGLQS